MQSMSSDSAYKHDGSPTPRQWADGANVTPDVYEEQEDQWGVLRHAVEGKQMQQSEQVRAGWEQHNTHDGLSIPSQAPTTMPLEQAAHHVDIVVVGIGGAGMNAINRMMEAHVRGVRFIAMNTDAQVLTLSAASSRICLGPHYTKGLGAGGNASVGMRAATESATDIRAALGNADLVFIAAGLGGGTGTGAAPVVASIAKKLGALTIGIVTLPFTFEGSQRKRIAQAGLMELSDQIDALITVPNDRLLSMPGRDRSLTDAFRVADDVLRQGVQGIAEVINVPGMVNVDFADVRSVLHEAGTALMSIGQGQGRNRAQQAAEEAVAGGFLKMSIRGAKRVLFNISGGEDMTLFEVNEVAECIGQAIEETVDITFGAVVDPTLRDTIRVTLIAAGMEEQHTARLPAIRPEQLRPTPIPSSPAPGAALPFSNPPVQSVYPPSPLQPMSYPAPAPMQPQPPVVPAPGPPPMPAPPVPPAPGTGFPGRQQRSLNDLRGIRSMGRRFGMPKGNRAERDEEAAGDVPPFLKRLQ